MAEAVQPRRFMVTTATAASQFCFRRASADPFVRSTPPRGYGRASFRGDCPVRPSTAAGSHRSRPPAREGGRRGARPEPRRSVTTSVPAGSAAADRPPSSSIDAARARRPEAADLAGPVAIRTTPAARPAASRTGKPSRPAAPPAGSDIEAVGCPDRSATTARAGDERDVRRIEGVGGLTAPACGRRRRSVQPRGCSPSRRRTPRHRPRLLPKPAPRRPNRDRTEPPRRWRDPSTRRSSDR